eukprot:Trichotokara_eunicae@DN1872_c0_g1_i1.p1
MDEILEIDPKNICTWEHLLWLLQTYGIEPEREWRRVGLLLEADELNHSAWNFRSFLVSEIGGRSPQEEVDFCIPFVKNCPSNESVWRYLLSVTENLSLTELTKIEESLRKVVEEPDSCRWLLWWRLMTASQRGEEKINIVNQLIIVDPDRAGYYSFVMDEKKEQKEHTKKEQKEDNKKEQIEDNKKEEKE